jgi:hypothetical protein
MQRPTSSTECRAEVSGKIDDCEVLEGERKGGLNCLLMGYVNRTSCEANRAYCYYFVMIAKEGPEKTAEPVEIPSFALPGQDRYILELRNDMH